MDGRSWRTLGNRLLLSLLFSGARCREGAKPGSLGFAVRCERCADSDSDSHSHSAIRPAIRNAHEAEPLASTNTNMNQGITGSAKAISALTATSTINSPPPPPPRSPPMLLNASGSPFHQQPSLSSSSSLHSRSLRDHQF